jgi:hypothetical protein
MFSLAAIWTWFLSKLSVKAVLIFLFLAALVGAGWYGYDKLYDHIYAQGVAAQKSTDDKTISGLNAQIAQGKKDLATSQAQTAAAKTELAAYVSEYNTYVAQTKANEAKLQQQQTQVVNQLNGTISKLQTQLKQAQTGLTNDIPTFIPPDGSTACQLPRGLILLYNASLTGTDSSGGFTTTLGLDTDAYDASGVSCSTFAGYLIDNGLAAYSNRQLLIEWQQWYSTNEALINAAIAAEQATPVPTAPAKTTKAAPAAPTAPTSSTSTIPAH